uniref:Uncharacterized protein n=1 Tax=Emberiza spodocephala ambidensovirus TaxID=2794446 RepID=A0A8A4XEA9_9VIRU|nr:MAG: hypothetical protein [Emberiza spodocephala ambidensovirus]
MPSAMLSLIWKVCVYLVVHMNGLKMSNYLLTKQEVTLVMVLSCLVWQLQQVDASNLNDIPEERSAEVSLEAQRRVAEELSIIHQQEHQELTTMKVQVWQEEEKVEDSELKSYIDYQNDSPEPESTSLMISSEIQQDLGIEKYQACLSLANLSKSSTYMLTKASKTSAITSDVHLCSLKQKWFDSINDVYTDFNNTFENLYWHSFTFNHFVDKKNKLYNDCMYLTRGPIRTVPIQSCYWTTKLGVIHRTNEFWNLWDSVGPDILYMYDFVLYNNNDENLKENSLWYLIAYIKMIALEINNPYDVIKVLRSRESYRKMYHSLNDQLEQLKLTITSLSRRLTRIEVDNISLRRSNDQNKVVNRYQSTDMTLLDGNIFVSKNNKDDVIVDSNKNIHVIH